MKHTLSDIENKSTLSPLLYQSSSSFVRIYGNKSGID